MVLIGTIGFYLGIDIRGMREPNVNRAVKGSGPRGGSGRTAQRDRYLPCRRGRARVASYAIVFDEGPATRVGIRDPVPGGCSASSCRSVQA